jgi:hypothetical protein
VNYIGLQHTSNGDLLHLSFQEGVKIKTHVVIVLNDVIIGDMKNIITTVIFIITTVDENMGLVACHSDPEKSEQYR